jgi:predicted HTH domain antitoxin
MELQHDLKDLAKQRGQSDKQFFTQIAVSMYKERYFSFQEAANFIGVDDLEMQTILGNHYVKLRWDEIHASRPKVQRKAGALQGGLLYMAEDFDAPLEDFADYM